ncbi:MAG TPA: hypothetical protein VIV12_06635 [Streptosporangiaceae bacterium]
MSPIPKQSGLSFTTLSVDDSGGVARDIRNDITSVSWATPRGVQDVTGIDKAAFERLLLTADGTIQLNGVFNPDANMSHSVFKTVPSTSVQRTVSIGIGGITLAMEMLFSDYQVSRADSGELTWQVSGVLANGSVPTYA